MHSDTEFRCAFRNSSRSTAPECGAIALHASVARLMSAYEQVLGGELDDCFRGMCEALSWYHSSLSTEDVFSLWVQHQLSGDLNASWVFEPVRASERRRLIDVVGIDRSALRRPADAGMEVLRRTGLPAAPVYSLDAEIREWEWMASEIENAPAHTESAIAIQSRKGAERILRTLVYFYSFVGCHEELASVVLSPGRMRVPPLLRDAVAQPPETRLDAVQSALSSDGWADLGFLNILARKFSVAIDGSLRIPSDVWQFWRSPLLGEDEADAFDSLARALQAYAHDRGDDGGRSRGLAAALRLVARSVREMATRNVLPAGARVLESGVGLRGPTFRVVMAGGDSRALSGTVLPRPGDTIFVGPHSVRQHGRAVWAPAPWAPLARLVGIRPAQLDDTA